VTRFDPGSWTVYRVIRLKNDIKVTLRPTVIWPVYVGVKPHLGPLTRFLLLSDTCGFVDVSVFSAERTGLSFTIVSGPRQRSHSRVRVPPDPWQYFTASDSRLPQRGRPGPRIYIPQEQGGPVIPPKNCFPFASPPATRRVTVELFKPAFTRVENVLIQLFSYVHDD
jgi:hypothetical protein